MSEIKCPKCGSDNVQKCSVIYNNGTTNIKTTTKINGNVASETSGVSSTNLAQQLAPPKKLGEFWLASFGAGAMFILQLGNLFDSFLSFIWVCFCGLCSFLGFVASEKARKYNETQFPIDYEVWMKNYFCNRCGNIFHTE